jgi:hypothetical protein
MCKANYVVLGVAMLGVVGLGIHTRFVWYRDQRIGRAAIRTVLVFGLIIGVALVGILADHC